MVSALEREPRQRRLWGQIVARAWDDDCFRQRLLAEPEAVLQEAGMDVPGGISVRVVEDGVGGDDGVCLRLPPRPSAVDFIEDDLSVPGDGPNEGFGRMHNYPCACLSKGGCRCKK
jgi:hypothetical protein